MIADLDETILQLLKEEIPIKNNEIDISFEQPKRENSARWTKPTVNMFLYDVRENNVLRQHQWERLLNGDNGSNLARLKRTPMRVDCHYMLTTWAADPADEHRLLTRCLMVLFRFPVLPEERLVGTLQEPPFEIQARLASHDKLTNPAEVWNALDNEIRPGVSYIVTLALDPWTKTGIEDVHLVNEWPTVQVKNANEVTGTVRDGEGQPVPRAEVRIKERNLLVRTDGEGRYTFPNVAPGKCTFVVTTPRRQVEPASPRKPRRYEIKVPAESYDFEV